MLQQNRRASTNGSLAARGQTCIYAVEGSGGSRVPEADAAICSAPS